MKTPLLLLVGLLVMAPLRAGDPASHAVASEPVLLRPGEINNLTLGFGVITSIRLETKKKIDRILLGSQIVSLQVDEALGRIDIRPLRPNGATNMILTIDGVDYSFVIEITSRLDQVMYTRTFTVGSGGISGDVEADLMRLGAAPKLRPAQIDIVGITKVVERARLDAVYRQALSDFRQLPLNKVYQWNNCLIHLLEVDAFLDRDLLAFKVQWVNTSGFGLYLHPRQLEICVAGKPVRTVAAMQDATDSWVLPGQMDTLWVVVQGEKLGPPQDWSLRLPPSGADLKARGY
ncbi:MAG: hypothetical protein PHE83_18445 [Opitutaceae bacterium]|nr:hypothetical protein [Opitutaceae bacterium]